MVYGLKAINTILVFSLLAHNVSHEQFAGTSYLLSMGLMCANFMDFGYRLKLIKEFSEDKDISIDRVIDTFIVKISVSVLFFLIFVLFVIHVRAEEGQTFFQVAVFFLGAFFLSLANYFIQYFYAKKNYKVDFYANAIYTVFLVLGVLASLKTERVIFNIGLTFFVASVVTCIYSMFLFYKAFVTNWSFPVNQIITLKRYFLEVKKSLPYSLHVMLGALFVYIDIVFVEIYLDEATLGVYFVYNRYVYGMSLVTMTLSTFLFPYIAQYYNENKKTGGEPHKKLLFYQKYIKYIAIVGSLLAILIMKPLVSLLFGTNYLGLVDYKYLISFIFILKVYIIIPSLIITCNDKQMIRVYSLLMALVLSATLYPIILPKYGLDGAIYVNAISIILVTIIYGFFSYRQEKTLFGINTHE